MDFWRQVGRENGAKIDPRRHRKSDGKVDSVKVAKKFQQAVTTRRDPREEGKGKIPVHHAKPPQPRGWWE